ncbi:MAG: hypothetical protein R6W77_07645 [Trueperaceae bacterium]
MRTRQPPSQPTPRQPTPRSFAWFRGALLAGVLAALAACGGGTSLSVILTGTGGGTVTSAPAGIACGATCTSAFDAGTSVTLTAEPDGISAFGGWSGCASTNGTTCVVNVTSVHTVVATFVAAVSWTLHLDGSGFGAVRANDGAMQCTSDCTGEAAVPLQIEAQPLHGSAFTGWGGDCAGTSGTCTITMPTTRTVSAAFALTDLTQISFVASATGIACSTVAAGQNCQAAIRLDRSDAGVRGAQFDVRTDGATVVDVVKGAGVPGACLFASGPATVIVACPAGTTLPDGVLAQVTLTRASNGPMLLVSEDASVVNAAQQAVPVLSGALPVEARP